ncbi:MAG: AMP-binding protein [Chloroflexota bacterium]
MSNAETIPQFFLERVAQYGSKKVALRQKELGIWREFTWEDSYNEVRDIALGLLELGLKRGDHICTVGDNDRQYLWSYIAVQSIGATQVGIFTDAAPHEIEYVVNHCDATFVFARDQEQCDKLLEIRDKLPNVKRVIYWDDKGLWGYDEPWLISYDEVQALGRGSSHDFEAEVQQGEAEDMAVICYTSGTTGLPKGAMLSYRSIIAASRGTETIDPRYDTDNHVSILPLGWIAEHVLGVAPHVVYGIILNFPEEPETAQANIREIAPEGILYSSRQWDSIVSLVQVRMNESSWVNRKLYEFFLPIGYQVADAKLENKEITGTKEWLYRLGDMMVFGPLRDKMGLTQIRAAYTAGSALSPDAIRFFHALGVNLKQIYGSTEIAGGVTIHRDGDIKFASVGQPIPDATIRISDEGEVLVQSPTAFTGYYKNPEATEEAFWTDENNERWFCTGDAGYIDDDGHLIYLDRVKDMMTLATGDKFSPQFIEGRLKFNPYIQDVMAVGSEERDFVTALVIMNFDNVGRWAEQRGLGYTTFVDLSQKDEVYALIKEAVVDVNQNLPEGGRVRRFVLMHKEFDADEAEMTRTRKLRRRFLYERYDDIISGMYAGQQSIYVAAQVKYQDGSEGVVETDVKVMEL